MQNTILVTGGAGYIGSHICVALLDADFDVLIYDNLSNSSPDVVDRIQRITGKNVIFIEGDIRNKTSLQNLFENHPIHAVIHCAGLKAVGESVQNPLKYYDNNVSGSLSLIEAGLKAGIKKWVFSSTATVYGDPITIPVPETEEIKPSQPYAKSKRMIEIAFEDIASSDPSLSVVLLRYFNPVGAHSSGLIGENPNGIPNNLMPFITQVAVGRRKSLQIFGNDYPTKDGTGIRDYIHVVDLADGHVKALDYLNKQHGCIAINLGTGKGYSVLDVVNTFEQASGRKIAYDIVDRRPGDLACYYGDPKLAYTLLQWQCKMELFDMCKDSWNWQFSNPTGY